MQESGSGPNVPFEGNSSEEKLRSQSAQQLPRQRFRRLPDPSRQNSQPQRQGDALHARRQAASQGLNRRATKPLRGQKAPLPAPPNLRGVASVRSLPDRSVPAKSGRREQHRPSFTQSAEPKIEMALSNRAERRRRSQSSGRDGTNFTPSNRAIAPRGRRTRSGAALLYGTRLLILGVGVGVIAGTILSVWDPARYFTAGASQSETTEQAAPAPSPVEQLSLQLGQEILPLKNQIQALIAQQPQLTSGIMVVDLDSNTFLNLNAAMALPCASTIKLPVLVAFFEDVDAGKIRLDELLTMRPELVATESGDMQYQPPGSQFTALETASKMITISDNTATNMLIDRLGGKDALNQRFQSWGLTSTVIHNVLPDIDGTNTSSSQDLVSLLGLVSNGKLLSIRSRDRLLDIMRRTVTNSLLPSGLGEGATIAHKTGNIGGMTGDVGLVDMPSGKRYLISVIVKRPRNDDQGEELIRQVSRLTYQHFSQPAPNPNGITPGQSNQAPTPSSTASPLTNPQGSSQSRYKVAQP